MESAEGLLLKENLEVHVPACALEKPFEDGVVVRSCAMRKTSFSRGFEIDCCDVFLTYKSRRRNAFSTQKIQSALRETLCAWGVSFGSKKNKTPPPIFPQNFIRMTD